MSLRCAACLSSDRHLTQTKKIFCFTNVWHDVKIKLTSLLCWECVASFKRIWQFKQKVMNAQKVLNSQQMKNDSSIKCLSSLSIHKNEDIIKMSEECVKDEMLDLEYLEDDYDNEFMVKTEEQTNEEMFSVIQDGVVFKDEVQVLEFETFDGDECDNILVKKWTEEEMERSRLRLKEGKRYKWSRYKCELCLLGYSDKETYKRHLNRNHSEMAGPYTCHVCQSHFGSGKLLGKHMSRHYTYYECSRCGICEHTTRKITQHYARFHGKSDCVDWVMDYRKPSQERTFICNQCHKVFNSKRKLCYHIKMHNVVQEHLYCVECNLQFKNISTFTNHITRSAKHRRDDKIMKYECTGCKKRFYCKITLQRHYNAKHSKVLPFSCDLCFKRFIRHDQLKNHVMFIHDGVARPKDKMCTVCGKGFNRQSTLLNHIRTHTGDRPFQCDICPSKFSQLTSLTKHVKTVHLKICKRRKVKMDSKSRVG